jgi:hypothetical protein
MVRVTAADIQAIDYLNSQTKGKIFIEAYTFYFERFLPDWRIEYLWLPQTYQLPTTHPLDPNDPSELAMLKQYDYIYIVDNQVGWTPAAIKLGFADKYLGNTNFELVDHASSRTNEVYLFKVN